MADMASTSGGTGMTIAVIVMTIATIYAVTDPA
jgi:hypothetical protein